MMATVVRTPAAELALREHNEQHPNRPGARVWTWVLLQMPLELELEP